MSEQSATRRWTGWTHREPSLVRPFPTLEVMTLEDRTAPANFTWTGAGLNNLWSNPANWQAGVAPTGVSSNNEDLIFSSGSSQFTTKNDLSGGVFNSIAISSSNYTLNGNKLQLGYSGGAPGTGSIIVGAGAQNNVVNIPLLLGAPNGNNQNFTVNAGGELTVNSMISGTTGSVLTKDGIGVLTFTNDNSGFTGQILLVPGQSGNTLIITHPRALGSTSANTVVGAGAVLEVRDTGNLGIANAIQEPLFLNGLGAKNLGALRNGVGNNLWTGKIQLTDSASGIGASKDSTLTINAVISDLTTSNLEKEDQGEIILAGANTYRGQTIVNDGILTITNKQALGAPIGVPGNLANGTVVKSNLQGSGQLRMRDTSGLGFTVVDEVLELNGNGVTSGITPDGRISANPGAFANTVGNNTWAGPVRLGSPNPDGLDVTMGVAPATTLVVSGVVSSPNGSYTLIKRDTGRLVFNNANTYTGVTLVQQGILTIRDSKSLGTTTLSSGYTRVSDGAALELEVELPDAKGNFPIDAHNRPLQVDSVTGDPFKLLVSEPLIIAGRGMTNTGALRNVTGTNIYAGNVYLAGGEAAIGVDADVRAAYPRPTYEYFTDDFSLTVTGEIKDDELPPLLIGTSNVDLVKRNDGHLILPNANTYSGETFIEQGWVTIQNDRSLGADILGLGQTRQPGTTVSAGAALHLRVLNQFVAPLNVSENLTLAGDGMTSPYAFINKKGALENIAGNNTLLWDVHLGDDAGIGVEQVDPAIPSELTVRGQLDSVPDTRPVFSSPPSASGVKVESSRIYDTGGTQGTLTLSYEMFVNPDQIRVYYPPRGNPGSKLLFDTGVVSGRNSFTVNFGTAKSTSTQLEVVVNEGKTISTPVESSWRIDDLIITTTTTPNDLIKLGSKRLVLQGPGTYDGSTDIREGIVRVQSDSALGLSTSGTKDSNQTYNTTQTTVQQGAVLELSKTVPSLNGGIETGVQIWNEHLVLNGQGQQIHVAGQQGQYTLTYKGDTTTPIDLFAPAIDIQNALNALPSIVTDFGSNNVVVALTSPNVYTVTFGNVFSPNFDPLIATILPGPLFAEVNITGANSTAPIVTSTSGNAPLVSLAGEDAWRGPITLNKSSRVETAADSRMNLLGDIDDVNSYVSAGSELVKRGIGELLLGGNNTFRGTTSIEEGIVTALTNTAFGSTANGTWVKDGAQLQLQGSLTISGEQLELSGKGVVTSPTGLLPAWNELGPAPTNNGHSGTDNRPTSGRITSIVYDPTDVRVIYVATAGGGAWKTKDGGLNWYPLFDETMDPRAALFGGSIAVSPSDPTVVYFATGESNGFANSPPNSGQIDDYAGSGVYRSQDSGETWTLLLNTDPAKLALDGENPLLGQSISKIVVDPNDSRTVYVASGNYQYHLRGGIYRYPNDRPDSALNIAPNSKPGIWRFQELIPGQPDWTNLTSDSSVSPARSQFGILGQAPYDATGGGPPNTAGPDDDYRIRFPQRNATWTDLRFVGNRLYAALGESDQRFFNGRNLFDPLQEGGIFNAVYSTGNPQSSNPSWIIGNGGTTLDDRDAAFPIGPVTAPSPLVYPGRNGYIRLTDSYILDPADTVLPFTAQRTVVATVTEPEYSGVVFPVGRTNLSNPAFGELLDIQQFNLVTQAWSTISTQGKFPSLPFGDALPTNRPFTDSYATPAAGQYAHALEAESIATFKPFDPRPGVLYVGGLNNLYMSTDTGNTWTVVSPDKTGSAPTGGYHSLTRTPTPTGESAALLIGADGGAWRWNGVTFDNLNGTLAITQLNSISPFPTDYNRAIAGAHDTGTQLFSDNLAWQRVDDNTGQNTGDIAYDPINPSVVYATRDGLLRKSFDGGITWTTIRAVVDSTIFPPAPFPYTYNFTASNYFPLVLDQVNPNRLVVGSPSNLSRGSLVQSVDGGASFQDLSSPLGNVTSIAIAQYQGQFAADDDFPTIKDILSSTYDPQTIYISDGSSIRVTKNGGTTWVDRTPGIASTEYTVEFTGSLGLTNVEPIIGAGSNGAQVAITTPQDGFPGVGGTVGKNEFQRVVVTGNGGTFTLSFRGSTTVAIPYNAPAAQVAAALQGLLSVNGTSRDEVQSVTFNSTSGGAFTLTAGFFTTPLLAYNESAANVQAALEALPGIGAGNVLVTSTPIGGGIRYDITFVNALSGANQPQIIANSILNRVVLVQNGGGGLNETQDLEIYQQSGTFTMSFDGQTTGAIAIPPAPVSAAALANTIRNALTALSTIGAGNVQVVPVPPGTGLIPGFGTSYRFRITFIGTMANTDKNMITTNNLTNPLTGLPQFGLAFATTVTDGGPGDVLVSDAVGPSGSFDNLTVDPSNRDTAFASVQYENGQVGPQVVRTTDGGRTWVDVTGAAGVPGDSPLPANIIFSMAIDPRTGTLYIGNNDGVWQLPNAKGNGPKVWSRVGSNMAGVQVRDVKLNTQLNTLTVATYGRGAFQYFLTDYAPQSGSLRAVSGASVWAGPITLKADATVSASGSQEIQNGITAASLNIVGTISDDANGPHTLVKVGQGTVTLSSANTYGGQTLVQEGVLQVNNPQALGSTAPTANTIVSTGAALELRTDLEREFVEINGDGIPFSGHNTGALRNIANANTFTGTLTLGTAATVGVDAGTSLTIGALPATPATIGTITDNGNQFELRKELTGTLVLAGANTGFSGLLTVMQGVVQVQDKDALGSDTKGTQVLDGGQLQISRNSVTLLETNIVSEPLTLSGTGTFSKGALLNVRNDTNPTKSNNNSWSGPITFKQLPNFAPATNPSSQISIGVSDSRDFLSIAGVISEDATQASFGLVKVGPGTLALHQANTYSGVTNVNEGYLRVLNNDALGPVISSEVQTITVIGVLDTLNYRLRFNSQGAPLLPELRATSTAAEVQAYLEAIPAIGTGNVLVTETPNPTGKVYTVTFRGALANQDVPLIEPINIDTNLSVAVNLAQQGAQGTVVAQGASLQLDGTLSGLTVGEVLTLNGDGPWNAGALNNVVSNNLYTGPITVATDATIGAVGGTELSIQSQVMDPTPLPVPAARVRKAGTGTVIFTQANPYSGKTQVDEGILRITDAQALGVSRSESQLLSLFGTNGAFTLTYGNQTTNAMSFTGISAAQIAAELNALPNIGGVGGSVSVSPVAILGGTGFQIDFGGTLTNSNVPEIIFTPVGLQTATTDNGTPSVAEKQTIRTYATGGGFTLDFNGQQTPSLELGSSALLVQNALNKLPNLGKNEVQTLQVQNNVGTFTITFNGDTTTPLNAGTTLLTVATAQQVQDALNLLPSINTGGGSVSVTRSGSLGNFLYTITFDGGPLSATNQPMITATPSGGASTTPASVADGSGGVRVTQAAIPGGLEYTVTFYGDQANINQPQITAALTPFPLVRNTVQDGALLPLPQPEIQTIDTPGVDGLVVFSYLGSSTPPLTIGVGADQVGAALNLLSGISKNEVQSIDVTGVAGTFTLTFGLDTTAPLPFDATADDVAAALNALPSIMNGAGYGDGSGVGKVSVVDTVIVGGVRHEITFGGSLSYRDQPQITSVGSGGATTGVDVTVTEGGGVDVTRAPNGPGYQYTITFVDSQSTTDFADITGTSTVTLGTGLPSTITDGQGGEIQALSVIATTGTFTLNFGADTTPALQFNASAATVQTALEALPSIGVGNIVVSRSPTPGGFVYTFYFKGSLGNSNLPEIVATVVNPGPILNVATLQDGQEGTRVASGATLQTAGPLTMLSEFVTLNGTGFSDIGALNSITGTTTWGISPILETDSRISTMTAGDRINFTVPITDFGGGKNLQIAGAGTVQYSAVIPNQYTGTTSVLTGTLQLSQPNGQAIMGNLVVGDSLPIAALVKTDFDNQIVDTANVTVNSDGTFDLNGKTDTIAALSVVDGQVTTGTGGPGQLTTNSLNMAGGTITLATPGSALYLVGNSTATSTAAGSATIAGPGQLVLVGTDRIFDVADGPQANDQVIGSVVTSLGTVGIIKQGNGRLVLSAPNTYTGPTEILAGGVQVDGTIGNVRLNGGAVSGKGTVGTIGGIAPGSAGIGGTAPGDNGLPNPAGILTASNTTWGPQTAFLVSLASSTPGSPTVGTDYDQLQVNGNIAINGATLSGTIGAGIQLNDTFTIIQATGGVSGKFAEPYGANVAFVQGQKFQVIYNPNSVVLKKILANATLGLASSSNPSSSGQPILFTFSVNPEPGAGASIAPGTTVTFTLDGVTYPSVPVSSNTVNFDPQAAIGGVLSVGTHTLSAAFSGDGVNFNSGTVTLSPVQSVVTPVIQPLVASPVAFSPAASFGSQDATTISTTVTGVYTGNPTPPTFTVTIRNSLGGTLRTFTGSGVVNSGSFPISVAWDGKDSGGVLQAEGTYFADATYSDQFGNSGTTAQILIVIDNTLPTATPLANTNLVIAPGTSSTVPTSTQLTASISDAHPGPWTITIRDSNNAIVRTITGTGTIVNATWDGLNDGGTQVPDGTYIATLSAMDTAGNPINPTTQQINVLTHAPALGLTTNSPTLFGAPITLTAYVVQPIPSINDLLTGQTVQFFEGSTFLGSQTLSPASGQQVATLEIPSLAVGSHAITVVYGGSAYFLPNTSAPTTHLVNKAINVTVNNIVKVYGDPMPTLTYTTTGLLPGDQLGDVLFGSPATTVTAGTPVGVYPVSIGSLTTGAGYGLRFLGGTITVIPAPLTITANTITTTYGSPVPPLTYSLSGLVNGDNASVVTGSLSSPVTQASSVGNYPITQGSVTTNANYSATFVPGTVTVNPARLRVVVNNETRLFNTPNPTFSATYDGLVLGESSTLVSGVNLTTAADVDSPPDTYPIFSSTTPTAPNYTVEVVPGTLSIVRLRPDSILSIPANITLGSSRGTEAKASELVLDGRFLKPVISDADLPVVPGLSGTTGGVRTASADFDGDGYSDDVLATGPGSITQVVILSGKTRQELFRIQPFEAGFTGGLYVAAGDINGDGIPELVVSPDEGGGPRVRIFDGNGFGAMADFYGIADPGFRGGVRIAVGDVNFDGYGDLGVAAGFGGGPRVALFSGRSIVRGAPDRLTNDFFAFEETLRNGAYISIGDINGDKKADLVMGAGPGGGPRVLVLNGNDLIQNNHVAIADFFAGDPNSRGGVRVTVKKLDGDQLGDIVAGAGDNSPASVTGYLGSQLLAGDTTIPNLQLLAFPEEINGVFVG